MSDHSRDRLLQQQEGVHRVPTGLGVSSRGSILVLGYIGWNGQEQDHPRKLGAASLSNELQKDLHP